MGINDGQYGNDHSWIGAEPSSWFQIDLGKTATVGLFKLGRDRTGKLGGRATDSLKIESSFDARNWQTIFEKSEIMEMILEKTIRIHVAPVQLRYIRVTVNSRYPKDIACVDEFEVYAPAAETPKILPAIEIPIVKRLPDRWRPVRRTTLAVEAAPMRLEGGTEVLELRVKNTGPMTALFCAPHPLIDYRTDLFIDNNHCYIPPGESRMITVRVKTSSISPTGKASDANTGRGLSLGATGWRLSCWNAEDVLIEPDESVLLAVGRKDQMCREFLGDSEKGKIKDVKQTVLTGSRPVPAQLPYLLDGGEPARFEFPASEAQVKQGARLRIHTADQSKEVSVQVQVTVNGKSFDQALQPGIGLQLRDPSHLAFPATLTFEIPSDLLKSGKNVMEIRVKNDGWFTWDALECVTMPNLKM